MLKQYVITNKVKEKVWAQEDITSLFDKALVLLRTPLDTDVPDYKTRKIKHHDGTELIAVEHKDQIALMLPEEESDYGEVISRYTSYQAIDDGVLMKNPAADDFPECNIITTNLFEYCKKRAWDNNWILKDEVDILRNLMKQAREIYENDLFTGEDDRNFFIIKGNDKIKSVWFCRNEFNKLTAMLPEDY